MDCNGLHSPTAPGLGWGGERVCDERAGCFWVGVVRRKRKGGTEGVQVGWPARTSKVEDVDEGCITAAGFRVLDIVLLVD